MAARPGAARRRADRGRSSPASASSRPRTIRCGSRRSRTACCPRRWCSGSAPRTGSSICSTALRVFARTMRGRPRRAPRLALRVPHREPGRAGPHARPAAGPDRRPAGRAPRPLPQSARRARGGARPIRPTCRARRTWPSGCRDPGSRRHGLDRARPRPRPRAAADARGRGRRPGAPPRALATGPPPATWCCRARSVRPLLVFKALQLLQCRGLADPLQDYVAFDLETTEMDAGAVRHRRARGGPGARPRDRGSVPAAGPSRRGRSAPRASAVHGYRDADVCDAAGAGRRLAGVPRVRGRRPARRPQRPHLRRARAPPPRRGSAGHRRAGVLRHAAAGPLAHGRERQARGSGAPLRRRARPLASRARRRRRRWSASPATWATSGWRAPGRRRWSSCSAGSAWRWPLDDDPRPDTRGAAAFATSPRRPRSGRYSGCLETYAEQVDGTDAPSAEELDRTARRAPAAGAPSERPPGIRALSRLRRPGCRRWSRPAPHRRLVESIELLLGRVALSRSDGCGDRRPPREPAHAARDQGARVLAGLHRRRRGPSAARRDRRWTTTTGGRSRRRAGCSTSA